MNILTYLTIIIISVVQSIFGVGVLLFGTPLLLLYGYEFDNTLSILLPISLTISLFQIIKDFNSIDFIFYRKFLIYSIPFVVLLLFLGFIKNINFNFAVGIFLIFFSLKEHSKTINKKLNFFDKISLIIMGVIHGLTNLGGSLLTAIVYNKNFSKNRTRATIAICYATFAFFQILTLVFLIDNSEVFYGLNMAFLIIGGLSFLITEKFVFSKIEREKYSKSFSVFLFLSGFLLVLNHAYLF